jgi:Flp pilus assembly protein TadG
MDMDRRRDLHRASAPGKRPGFVRARGESGAAAVEFALIFPILLILVLGIIEFGVGYHAWDTTQNGAREAARLAAVNPIVGEIDARARAASSFIDPADLVVSIDCRGPAEAFAPCPGSGSWEEGDIVRVTVSYAYPWITPLPGFVGLGAQMDMTSVAEARFEGL